MLLLIASHLHGTDITLEWMRHTFTVQISRWSECVTPSRCRYQVGVNASHLHGADITNWSECKFSLHSLIGSITLRRLLHRIEHGRVLSLTIYVLSILYTHILKYLFIINWLIIRMACIGRLHCQWFYSVDNSALNDVYLMHSPVLPKVVGSDLDQCPRFLLHDAVVQRKRTGSFQS